MGNSNLEQKYIEDVHLIGKEKGNSLELSQLCRKAHEDYQKGLISSDAYGKIYSLCCQYAYPR